MKKKIYIIVLLVLLIITIYFFCILFNNKLDLKGIYENEKDIDNIKIYARNIATNKETLITEKSDINIILNNLIDIDVNRILFKEDLIGGYCRLVILNTETNKKININIGMTRININSSKEYKTNYNIYDNIRNIVMKYDENMVF